MSVLKEELEFREEMYPPYMNLARVLISNKDYQKGYELLKSTEQRLRAFSSIDIVGAGAAPIERIANKWRFNILLRSNKRVELLKAMHSIFGIRDIEVDIDPVDFA